MRSGYARVCARGAHCNGLGTLYVIETLLFNLACAFFHELGRQLRDEVARTRRWARLHARRMEQLKSPLAQSIRAGAAINLVAYRTGLYTADIRSVRPRRRCHQRPAPCDQTFSGQAFNPLAMKPAKAQCIDSSTELVQWDVEKTDHERCHYHLPQLQNRNQAH